MGPTEAHKKCKKRERIGDIVMAVTSDFNLLFIIIWI